MGCSICNKSLSAEDVVVDAETQLGFSKLSFNEIDFITRKYSTSGEVSLLQWRDISEALNISSSNADKL